MSNRLYRSRADRMAAGVCGGLGEYLRIDSTIIRLIFVLLALSTGVGVMLYLILWIIVPYEGEGEMGSPETTRTGAGEIAERARQMGDDVRQAFRQPNPQTALIAGGALIVLGFIFLVQNLDLAWLRWLNTGLLWALLLIAAGVALILRRLRD
ncbi:MAG: PspC domain-containing protein [Chloroflexi bacterium]|nr:PspC domain-containing protein [Chloroflexota bacterium]